MKLLQNRYNEIITRHFIWEQFTFSVYDYANTKKDMTSKYSYTYAKSEENTEDHV